MIDAIAVELCNCQLVDGYLNGSEKWKPDFFTQAQRRLPLQENVPMNILFRAICALVDQEQ